jgi:hypothetical protein
MRGILQVACGAVAILGLAGAAARSADRTLDETAQARAEIEKIGSFKYSAREVSDLVIRVYGDSAVVTGRARQAGTENGGDYGGENRFTRVYVKRNGRWITVALQVTLVEKPLDLFGTAGLDPAAALSWAAWTSQPTIPGPSTSSR